MSLGVITVCILNSTIHVNEGRHAHFVLWQLTFIALPLVSMGSNNAVITAIAVIVMKTMIVAMVLWTSNVCKR